MNYNNEDIRRKDRLLSYEEGLELLNTAEYGVLSMLGSDKYPYGIPISYVWNRKESIYFHCAPQGVKLNNLEINQCVSFCVVAHTHVIPEKFTTEYQSILIKGKVCLTLSDDEKMDALELIVEKYSPKYKILGRKYAEKSFHRTVIIRLDIETISGKSKPCQSAT